MFRLMDIAGVRLIERCMASGDEGMIPGCLSIRAFADHVAIVHFGTTEAGLFPEPPGQEATEAEALRVEALTEKPLGSLRSDAVSGDENLIAFFRQRGFDITNDERRLARCAALFTRLIEAGHLGWLNPCPCTLLERWRRTQMSIGTFVTGRPANDDNQAAWVARFGSVA